MEEVQELPLSNANLGGGEEATSTSAEDDDAQMCAQYCQAPWPELVSERGDGNDRNSTAHALATRSAISVKTIRGIPIKTTPVNKTTLPLVLERSRRRREENFKVWPP